MPIHAILKDIALQSSVSVRTAYNALEQLEKSGILKTKKQFGKLFLDISDEKTE
jgi:DNA-binding transcriptional regulator YhcF (GntR family)